MPEESYEFSDAAYERLYAAGIPPLSVLAVLYGGAMARRHTRAVLQVAGRDRTGLWLVVALVETTDDHYAVVGARRLDNDEIAAIVRIRGERR